MAANQITTFGQSIDYIETYLKNMFALNKMSPGKEYDLKREFLESLYNEYYALFGETAEIYKKTHLINTVDGTATYTLPADILDVKMVFYAQGTDQWQLYPYNYRDKTYWETISGSQPSGYTVSQFQDYTGRTLKIQPAPSNTDDVISVAATFSPPALENTTDEPLIPQAYRTAICDAVIYKVQLMAGLYDQTQGSALRLWSEFESEFKAKANECRKAIEFGAESANKFKNLFRDAIGRYIVPSVNHSPVVTKISYLNDFKIDNVDTGYVLFELSDGEVWIYNEATGAERLRVDDEGLWINGAKLAFLGTSGTANFAGQGATAYTSITIPDKGSTSNYNVKWTAYGDETVCGTIGEVTIEKVSGTEFRVRNAGLATSEFYWELT